MEICQNCGAEVTTKYCPNCGQERITKRLEVISILHEVTHGIFHWENSILRTLKLIVIQPGKFIQDYINGKRKSFVKPFSYFLFIQTVYVVVFHLMSEKFFAYMNIAVTSDSQAEKVAELQHMINKNVNYLNFLLPLLFAFFFRLFLKKKTGVNYAESLVFSFYTFATILVFGIFFMLISIIDIRLWSVRFLVNYVYLVFAVMQFGGYTKVKGFFTASAVNILSYITFIILIGGISLLYIKYIL